MSNNINKNYTPETAAKFLTEVSAVVQNKDPMIDYQLTIGQMLPPENKLPPKVKLQAAGVLCDMIANDPTNADTQAVRRLSKFAIHSNETTFGGYTADAKAVMNQTVGVLIRYVSEKIVDFEQEELEILGRVAEKASYYDVKAKKVNMLKCGLENVYAG